MQKSGFDRVDKRCQMGRLSSLSIDVLRRRCAHPEPVRVDQGSVMVNSPSGLKLAVPFMI